MQSHGFKIKSICATCPKAIAGKGVMERVGARNHPTSVIAGQLRNSPQGVGRNTITRPNFPF